MSVKLFDDVAAAATIVIQSGAHRYVRETISVGMLEQMQAVQSNTLAQREYEVTAKEGAKNVAEARSQLFGKYGIPSKRHKVDVPGRPEAEVWEWSFDGLHVQYSPDAYEDTLLIEVDSVRNRRLEGDRKRSAAEPNL